MTSRRVFAVAVVALSAAVAGAVASIVTSPAGSGNPGETGDRRVPASLNGSQAQSAPRQPLEAPVPVRPPVLLVRVDDAAPSTPLVFEQARYDVTGPTTVQATVITDYGRPTEQRRALTLRLTTARDVVDIGAVVAGSRRQGAK